MTVRFEVLGELKVWNGDQASAVTADKQRTILAVLIAARGLDVSVDQLLESVWGDDLPANGRSALRFHISKLRSILQPDVKVADSVIQTTATGYRLEGSLATVDAWTLQDRVDSCSLVASARPKEAIETLQKAVDSYGLYLSEFAYDEFAQQPRREWDEFVIGTALTCADLLVNSGGPDAAAALLQPLLDANPYRESIASKLVLALHGADRQVEALRMYDHVREQLADVGVEPGFELRSSLDKVLSYDVALPRREIVRHNLPIQIDRLVGRDEDLEQLSALASTTRLLRVAGLPGVGKTALVNHFVGGVIDSFGDGVIWIGTIPTDDIDQDAALILTEHFMRPVDSANAAVTVSEMNCLVVIDGTASYGDVTPFISELLGGSEVTVIVISDDDGISAPVFTVRPLHREEAWSLFDTVGGTPSGAIDGPDLLMEVTGGIPALIRFGATASRAEAHEVLRSAIGEASAGLLDSALEGIDERFKQLLGVVSTFSGSVSLVDVGEIDEEMEFPDVLKLIDGGWLISSPEGVEVPAVVQQRLEVKGLTDQRALGVHARSVSGWQTDKAVRRFRDTENAITYLAETDAGRAVELFDRVAPRLWNAGRYGSVSQAAAAIAASAAASDATFESVLYYGAYAGLRTGNVQLSRDCQKRFDGLLSPTAGHAIESALLAADVAWFDGRSETAAEKYARANTLATSQGDARAVLGAFGEALVHAYTQNHTGFKSARDRVVSEATDSTTSLRAEILGIEAILADDISVAITQFRSGLRTLSSTDRRSLQRRLLECHILTDDEEGAEGSWAEIEADVAYTGVPLDSPTLFAGSVFLDRFGSSRDAIRLLHRGARSLTSSPAALWVMAGLATGAMVGRCGPQTDRIEIALARLRGQTGITLLPPFESATKPLHGPVDIGDVIELLLATEAPTR
jgi:DNA-binding SARP family transcriptional activator